MQFYTNIRNYNQKGTSFCLKLSNISSAAEMKQNQMTWLDRIACLGQFYMKSRPTSFAREIQESPKVSSIQEGPTSRVRTLAHFLRLRAPVESFSTAQALR